MHKENMDRTSIRHSNLIAGVLYSMTILPLYISVQSWINGNLSSLLICLAMTCSLLWFALNPNMLMTKGSLAALFSSENLTISKGRALPYAALGFIALSGMSRFFAG